MVNGTDWKHFSRFSVLHYDVRWLMMGSTSILEKCAPHKRENKCGAHTTATYTFAHTLSAEANARNIVKCHLIADDKYNVFAFI